MENILYEINGKKYLLVEIPMLQGYGNVIDAIIKKHNGIFQGLKEIKRESFWHKGYAIVKTLIPETNIEKFNTELNVQLKSQ